MSLYGKAAHESHRTTQKHPYLRYRNVPTPKKQPPPQVKTVKGKKKFYIRINPVKSDLKGLESTSINQGLQITVYKQLARNKR